jgi:hypothetical protein
MKNSIQQIRKDLIQCKILSIQIIYIKALIRFFIKDYIIPYVYPTFVICVLIYVFFVLRFFVLRSF